MKIINEGTNVHGVTEFSPVQHNIRVNEINTPPRKDDSTRGRDGQEYQIIM